MNERAFVERRKPDWDRLETILKHARVGLSALSKDELNALGRIYRATAGDLAYVRTHSVNDNLIDYLNDLVGRGHGLLYVQPRKSFKQGLIDFVYNVPAVVRRRQKFIYSTIGITLIGAFIGVLISLSGPGLKDYFIPPQFKEVLEAWKHKEVNAGSTPEMVAFSGYLWFNNTMVSLQAFGYGMTFGVLTVYLLLTNGLILGLFTAELTKAHSSTFFWAGVLPHGVTELGAIFLSAAGGLILAKALLMPGDKRRLQAVKDESSDAFTLLAAAVIMLIFAAGVEAWFSHQRFSYFIKFGFATLSLIGWLAYWIGLKPKSRLS